MIKKIKYFFLRSYYKWFRKNQTLNLAMSYEFELGEVVKTSNGLLLTNLGKQTYLIDEKTRSNERITNPAVDKAAREIFTKDYLKYRNNTN